MNQRKFGRTNLNISEIGLDLGRVAGTADEDTVFAVLDAFHAAGGTFIQVSAAGLRMPPTATSVVFTETLLAGWLTSRKIPRDRIVVGCQFRFQRPPVGGSIAFANLARQRCEESLRRLRGTYVDFLVCDWSDGLLPIDDAVDAFDVLTRAGYVRYLVANGFPSWRLVDAVSRAAVRNRARFEGVLATYSLGQRSAVEFELLPLAAEFRLGLLTRQPTARIPAGASPIDAAASRLSIRLAELADEQGSAPASIALSWVLQNQHVSSVLIAPSSAEEAALLCASAARLTPQQATELTLASELAGTPPVA